VVTLSNALSQDATWWSRQSFGDRRGKRRNCSELEGLIWNNTSASCTVLNSRIDGSASRKVNYFQWDGHGNIQYRGAESRAASNDGRQEHVTGVLIRACQETAPAVCGMMSSSPPSILTGALGHEIGRIPNGLTSISTFPVILLVAGSPS